MEKDNQREVKPIENGNAEIITELTSAYINSKLIRYKAIAEYYCQEPFSLQIKMFENDDNYIELEQIFRFKFVFPNCKTISWSVYSNERNFEETDKYNILLRNVVWNNDKDIDYYKNTRNKSLLKEWPEIQINNIYLSKTNAESLIKNLTKLDKIISSGIIINERIENKNLKWLELEIMRLYDWGKVYSAWCNFMHNELIEHYLFELLVNLEFYSLNEKDKIHKIILDYTFPTSDFKKVVYEGK